MQFNLSIEYVQEPIFHHFCLTFEWYIRCTLGIGTWRNKEQWFIL